MQNFGVCLHQDLAGKDMVAKYELSSTDQFTNFHFESIGPRGVILKRINFQFFEYYPEAFLVFAGSTDSRTRLYQVGIAKHHHILEFDFEIQGLMKIGGILLTQEFGIKGFCFLERILNLSIGSNHL
jgi:hypothetical protein